ESLGELEAAGCRTLSLDVCDEASMAGAVAAVEQAEGAVWGLINNAGYSQSGALESVPVDSLRRQFETNVFGLVRMCQLVLSGMRKQGEGRIVNLGSMGGKLTFPGGREDDGRGLRGPAGEARRRSGRRREGDRDRSAGQAAASPLPGDALVVACHPPASPAERQDVGSHDGHPIQAARTLSARAPAQSG
ncbi:MAG: SDR family NAD(P)-dependent oxidoreductase, partial [Solirubrobacterales bacterium]